jgi:hypothetical protein
MKQTAQCRSEQRQACRIEASTALCLFAMPGGNIMNKSVTRMIGHVLVASMLALGMPLPSAQAGLIPTQALSGAQAQADRARIQSFLEREDVLGQMLAMGVDVQSAKDRVAALSDEEVARIAGKLDQMPAGGDVLGILFAVFIVLLVTDILGFTKVFPFTRTMR